MDIENVEHNTDITFYNIKYTTTYYIDNIELIIPKDKSIMHLYQQILVLEAGAQVLGVVANVHLSLTGVYLITAAYKVCWFYGRNMFIVLVNQSHRELLIIEFYLQNNKAMSCLPVPRVIFSIKNFYIYFKRETYKIHFSINKFFFNYSNG